MRQGGGLHLFGNIVAVSDSNVLRRKDSDKLAKKVLICLVAIVVVAFLSLCFLGAQGQYYTYGSEYGMYSPLQVAQVIYEHAYNAIAQSTHLFAVHDNEWLLQNVPGYWAIWQRAGVVGITIVCAILLSLSGMLYQNAFRNPIAGPSMLGVSSGVSLGTMLMVALYGSAAPSMVSTRYAICYAAGGAILAFVIAAGRKLSGKGKPFDIVTMLLIGSIVGQLFGFIVSYVTLFVMDEEQYLQFYTLSQMLTVDASATSWATLGVATIVSFVPIWLLRFKMGTLVLDDQEARTLGVNPARMKAVALICGAIMILAAQVHVGMVSLVSLVVPHLARSTFGCSFKNQLVGSLCIGIVLLLACRCICDCIPFVGDGLALGSVVSVVALPLFVVVMAKQMRGWS